MSVLRIYDPAECDFNGVPLDWERCRTSNGGGGSEVNGRLVPYDCPTCGGHGSLKAAALAYLTTTCGARDESAGAVCNRRPHEDRWHGEIRDGETWAAWGGGESRPQSQETARCEGCGHPMSAGTYEGPTRGDAWRSRIATANAREALRAGREPDYAPNGHLVEHWSPCDSGCRHGAPFRWRDPHVGPDWELDSREGQHVRCVFGVEPGYDIEASWRQVDVRTLGWAHDLRPEKLAILCLRCWTERSSTPAVGGSAT